MYSDQPLGSEQLYQQGLRHFVRGEWQAAIDTLSQLQDSPDLYPDIDDLVSDARLKLRFEGMDKPTAMAPPRRSVLLPILAGLAVCLALLAGFAFYQLRTPAPVAEAPTPVPPTTVPTAPPAPVVVVPPTPAPTPTEAPVLPGTVIVNATDESVFYTTPRNVAIIFDGSGSMRRKVAGTDRERWQVAQEALRTFLTSGNVSSQASVALRTYGRQRTNDCGDYELVQPLSRYNPEALLGLVDTLQPIPGARTPLAFSIRAMGEDLRAAEGSTAVIVITDGDETCNGDPAGEAANFVKDVPERKVHVIGFALDNPADQAKLQQIAVNGSGLYFDASNGAELAEALRQTVVLSYQLLGVDGTPAGQGSVGGEPLSVPPGSYTLRINTTPPIEKVIEINNGSNTRVSVRQDIGGLVAEVEGQ